MITSVLMLLVMCHGEVLYILTVQKSNVYGVTADCEGDS